ncbi:glycosyltransferase family 87 protein [Corynebacterium sp. HMSC063G05]|uniref:glycosyltransferase family 87 protein n=1 Tax=Corynebacterium sp. HMSC063G05 TaxID=1739255 RepID=UPI00143A25F5|nr:glycosyltransferase family 87 protein [Corynebacterium sp. HMSC063G05]
MRTIEAMCSGGTDFSPIWRAVESFSRSEPVYDENYQGSFPHYLYSPGATLLVAPFSIFGTEELARNAAVILGFAAFILAVSIFAAILVDHHRTEVALLSLFLSLIPYEPLNSTLQLTNINAFLALVLAVFVVGLVKPGLTKCASDKLSQPYLKSMKFRYSLAGGVAFGFLVTFKPQFGVLGVLALIQLDFALLFVAILFFVLFFAAGYSLISEPRQYFENLIPYLREPRAAANGSVGGLAHVHNWSQSTVIYICIVLVALCVVSLILIDQLRTCSPEVWAVSGVAVLLSTGFLCSGLLQHYYSIWLIPFAMSIFSLRSPMHYWLNWLCIIGCTAAPPLLLGFLFRADTQLAVSACWSLIPVGIILWKLSPMMYLIYESK